MMSSNAIKRIAFRVDASYQIGSGHVMRCLTIADAFKLRKVECVFICRKHPGNLINLIQKKGYQVYELSDLTDDLVIEAQQANYLRHSAWLGCTWQEDARETIEYLFSILPDLLIIDHYAIDEAWEERVNPFCKAIAVIDDLADRRHKCNYLLDQNYYRDFYTRYNDLVPPHCKLMLGPEFCLLRSEFLEERAIASKRTGTLNRALVFFGGMDPTCQTQKVLEAFIVLSIYDVHLDVVIGAGNQNLDELTNLVKKLPRAKIHHQIDNMAELINSADIGFGAGGVAMWERCYLGLPTITVTFAENQVKTTKDVADLGAIWYLGDCRAFTSKDYQTPLSEAVKNPQRLIDVGRKSSDIVGFGTNKVLNNLLII